ncbi:hypothetical protein OG792_15730 [Micromonospora sp. NBC_01699]|uniref:hypothetical protein n=1 Tax=Micromonospora sp. NBC_01699 TaxID=2975984 RepID=UPI002E355B48|nr:hypothetical protein [Micromonospora sp. NBC_01699]
MRSVQRTASPSRRAALAALVGGGATASAWAVSFGTARLVETAFPSPDANIGLGLFVLGLPPLAVPLVTWWWLRRTGVPAAGPVAAGTVAVHLAAIATPWPIIAAAVVAVGVYTGAAVLVVDAALARRDRPIS